MSQQSKITENDRKKLIELLIKQLQQNSDIKTKQWFDNYLKGAIEYRGLKTPSVKKIVKNWYLTNNLNCYTYEEQLMICSDLITSPFAEDKFAGTIYIENYLISEIDYQILLDKFNLLFQAGYLFDWSTTDWFSTRVLSKIIIKNGIKAAEIIANWRKSANFWQRRASIVSFREASKYQDYHPLIEKIIDTLVKEDERFMQTGIGWLLADMSKHYPTQVEALFRKYIQRLDKEVIYRHSKHLLCHEELKQQKINLK